MKRIIVGITGASGVIMGYQLMAALNRLSEWETHLVVSDSARLTWDLETERPIEELFDLADYVHDEGNMAASISSGSFVTEGMIVLPCSMKSLAGVVSGFTDNLLLRAADVCLKENRKLILVPREMPLGKVHLRNMAEAADLGCTIIPPMLTFYNIPETLDNQVHHVVGKILMQFGIEYEHFEPWEGIS
ncbi:MAG: UbiX family flavin prenyltransferase [Raoultibacter sp.]|jgi:4-hydroxy-3-polyprenylbenzoate decarboxylase